MPFHRESLFAPGPRRPLSSDQRRAWLARVELERRAGRLTPAHVDIARALLKHLAEDGRCDPSQATLAERSGYSPRTVARALGALHAAGLLDWQRRLVRRGARVAQTSNSYRLLLPQEPVSPTASRRTPSKNLPVQASIARLAIAPAPPFDPAARQALAEIAAARAARLSEAWAARHRR